MALCVFSLSAATLFAYANGLATTFEDYIATFRRVYSVGSPEYESRRALFEHRLELIHAQNSDPNRLWQATTNELTDRNDDELSRLRGWRRVGGDADGRRGGTVLLTERVHASKSLPNSVDWQHLLTLSHVPDQGSCGSCWAVSAATVLQAHHEIYMAGNRTFSAQQLVNCVQNPKKCGGSGGCDGATVELAMSYVLQSGLADTREVPYAGRDQLCAVASPAPPTLVERAVGAVNAVAQRLTGAKQLGGVSFGFNGYSKLPENRARPLMHALLSGPVAISVAAARWSWYGTGIFNDCPKDTEIDHAVVLVGYGHAAVSSFDWMLGQTDWFLQGRAQSSVEYKTTKFWTIQNSWGPRWGEHGRIRLFRHDTPAADEEYCGVDRDPKSGVACEPYPDSVPVCGMCGMLYDSVTPHFSQWSVNKESEHIDFKDSGLRGR